MLSWVTDVDDEGDAYDDDDADADGSDSDEIVSNSDGEDKTDL